MTSDSKSVSDLTRALLLGVSLGGAALVPVGCAQIENATGTQPDSDAALALCQRVLATEDHRDLERLFEEYPTSRCLNPTLSALPPQTLTQVSPAVLASVPNTVRDRIPPTPAAFLRFPDTGSSSGGGSSGGGY